MRVNRAAINLPLGFLQGGQFLPGLLAGSTRAQRKRTLVGCSPRAGPLAGGRRVVQGGARRARSTLEAARCVPAVGEQVKAFSARPGSNPFCRTAQ
jgi:hypothetical protein